MSSNIPAATAATSTTAQPLGRRALLRGAAWSVPAITLAAAAPAYADSTQTGSPGEGGLEPAPGAPALVCRDVAHRLLWDASTWTYATTNRQGDGTGTVLALPGEQYPAGTKVDPFTITVKNTFHGNMRPREAQGTQGLEGNMRVAPHNIGGTNRRGLEMWQALTHNNPRTASTVHNDRQTIDFDFGREVRNLQFTITDLDAHKYRDEGWFQDARWQYVDNAYLSINASRAVRGDRVTGSGTQSVPWRSSRNSDTTTSALNNTTSSNGNVQVTLDGPVRAFSLTFYNSETRELGGNGGQAIYLSDFTFTASTCK